MGIVNSVMLFISDIYKLKLTYRSDKPLKRLEKCLFISLTHDLSRGLMNNQLNNLTISPEGMPSANGFLTAKKLTGQLEYIKN